MGTPSTFLTDCFPLFSSHPYLSTSLSTEVECGVVGLGWLITGATLSPQPQTFLKKKGGGVSCGPQTLFSSARCILYTCFVLPVLLVVGFPRPPPVPSPTP